MDNTKKPWQGEPDEYDFTDDISGLPVALRRHPRLKHWCGYVGVPSAHPWHGLDYHVPDVDCHGGLIFGAPPLLGR